MTHGRSWRLASLALLVPAFAAAQVHDHQKCYRIRDTKVFKSANVTLTPAALAAAFPTERCQMRAKAQLLCVPVEKRVESIIGLDGDPRPPLPISGVDLEFMTVCYKIRCDPDAGPNLDVTDQMGARPVSRLRPKYLCMPAVPGLVTTTTTTTSSSTSTTLPRKIAFVTSQSFNGNFGGVTAGDDLCQAAAVAGGLTGTFFAWLSDSTGVSPNTRFTYSPDPYLRTDGVLIANDYADLTDGSLVNPIDADEFGALVPVHAPGDPADDVWTGTDEFGDPDALSGGFFCTDWTAVGGPGLEGQLHLTSPKWTNHQRISCEVPRRLYCFEQ